MRPRCCRVRSQLLALPGLRRGMIDLEHTQASMRIPVGKSVKPRAEDNVLTHAVCDRSGEFILSIPAAGRHECAESAREGVVLFRIGTKIVCGLRTDDSQS